MLCGLLSRLFKKSCCCASLKNQVILVIEDEPGQRLAIQRILEKQGYKIVLAENGVQGLSMARSRKPDMILLDVVMPDLSGSEVCRQLKEDPSTKNIPIIFLTSRSSPDEVVEQFGLGADMHLAKPIDARELITQIQISFDNQK